jgi:hypothetical protein
MISRAKVVMLVAKKIEKGEQFCVVLVVVRASLSIIKGLSIQSEVLGCHDMAGLRVTDLCGT